MISYSIRPTPIRGNRKKQIFQVQFLFRICNPPANLEFNFKYHFDRVSKYVKCQTNTFQLFHGMNDEPPGCLPSTRLVGQASKAEGISADDEAHLMLSLTVEWRENFQK